MKQCDRIDDCDFFNGGFRRHAKGEFFISDYCFETPSFCAIHLVCKTRGKEALPEGLLPHELNRIKTLV
jgi:hypothetical protein